MQKPSLVAWVLLVILALIWGSSFLLIKRGLEGLPPLQLGSLRIVSASVFLLPVAVTRIRRVEKQHWKFLLSVGLLGSFIPAFLFAIAQTRLDSGVTGVLNAMVPIFTVLVGWFVYKQRQGLPVLAGISLGFIGSAILSMAGGGSLAANSYVLLIILATLCYGTNLNVIKYHLTGLKALTVTSVSLMLAGPIAIVHLFGFTDYVQLVSSAQEAQLASVYVISLGILSTAIALILFNKLVQITEPVFTSSVTYLIPIVAVVWGVIDGEVLQAQHFIGMATIILGVYITNRVRRS